MMAQKSRKAVAAPRRVGATGPGEVIKYYCSFNNTIADVLANRGWKEVAEDEGWDFIWSDREYIYSIFDKVRLESWQKMNHYRNGREFCRKDLMAKNMKRRRRDLEKAGKLDEAAAYDFIPTTFVLPREYSMFVEEFKKVCQCVHWGDGILTNVSTQCSE